MIKILPCFGVGVSSTSSSQISPSSSSSPSSKSSLGEAITSTITCKDSNLIHSSVHAYSANVLHNFQRKFTNFTIHFLQFFKRFSLWFRYIFHRILSYVTPQILRLFRLHLGYRSPAQDGQRTRDIKGEKKTNRVEAEGGKEIGKFKEKRNAGGTENGGTPTKLEPENWRAREKRRKGGRRVKSKGR